MNRPATCRLATSSSSSRRTLESYRYCEDEFQLRPPEGNELEKFVTWARAYEDQ
jgi:hypothetical protein